MAAPQPSASGQPALAGATDSSLKTLFESKIKKEWEALKNKDKQAYSDLLADNYEAVEVDGMGERTKIQAINEVSAGKVYTYTVWGVRVTPLGPDATLVIRSHDAVPPAISTSLLEAVYQRALGEA